MTFASLVACEMCAAVFRRVHLQHGEAAVCQRCHTVLWRHTRLTPSAWLALAMTTAIVFCIANAYPIATVSIQGLTQHASLPSALLLTWRQGAELIALMCGLAVFALPLLQVVILLWMLAPLTRRRMAPGFTELAHLLGWLRPWSMVPVFLLGIVVAAVKLGSMASLSPGLGLGAFAVLTVLLTMLGRVSPRSLWRMAEESGATATLSVAQTDQPLSGCHSCGQVQPVCENGSCRRCGARLHARKPNHVVRTSALALAATILYIPANVLPVMRVSSVFGNSEHTILGGVIELWALGSWDLAIIVFIASVAVPLTKLLSLAVLTIGPRRPDPIHLRQRTRLYKVVEVIGPWSMLDVFVVVVLASMAHFSGLMQISAGPGAGAFGLVVVLTMLAADSFDPRYAWDTALTKQTVHPTPSLGSSAK